MYSSKKTTSSVRVCRACLSTDARLHDMRQSRLMEAYTTLTTLVNTKEDLPHYLCSYCAVLVLKCDEFRKKCIDTLVTLTNAQLVNGKLSLKYIRKMQNKKNMLPYSQTVTQHVSINEIGDDNYSIDYPERNISNNVIDLDDSDENVSVNDGDVIDAMDDKENDTISNSENEPYESDSDDSIRAMLNEVSDDDVKVLKQDDIRNELNDHDYPLNNNANKNITSILEEYLDKNGFDDDLQNFQVNLYCNKNTLTKIHEKEKMKLKIVEQVDWSEMNDKLLKILNKGGNREEKNKEIVSKSISDDAKYITIDFADMNETNPDLIDNNIDDKDNDYLCVPINTKLNQKDFKYPTKVDLRKFAADHYMDVTFYYTVADQIKSFEDMKNTRNYIESPFKCDICFKGYGSLETYNKHNIMHSESRGSYVCNICKFRYSRKCTLNIHKSRHTYKFNCKRCSFTTRYTTVAKNHCLWHTGEKYSCKHCTKSFNGRSGYYSHLKQLHPTSAELVRCEICGDSFYGQIGVRQHMKFAHRDMRSPECYCSVCETQFYCSDAFKAHRGTDGVCDTTHKYCVRCGESFDTEELLKEHEIEQQKPRDVFQCELCPKVFPNYFNYKLHRDGHQNGRGRKSGRPEHYWKRYERMCELCGKILQNQHLLKLHYISKHSTEKPYQCTYCNKKFKSSMVLKRHTLSHTGERPYKCSMCPQTFQCPSNLDRHKKLHTGERPHLCTICGKCFRTTRCVKAHVKYVHMKMPMPPRIRRKRTNAE